MKFIKSIFIAGVLASTAFVHAEESESFTSPSQNQVMNQPKEELKVEGQAVENKVASAPQEESNVQADQMANAPQDESSAQEDQMANAPQDESSVQEDEVAASMTPAERHQRKVEQEREKNADGVASPRMKAQQHSAKFPTEHHEKAYNSLSEKNQKAYDALEGHQQDKVAETYRNGGNHQRTMTGILKKDQKEHNRAVEDNESEEANFTESKGMEDSPANRAMKNQKTTSSKKKDDIFG